MKTLTALIIDDESENNMLLELYLKKYFKNIIEIFKSTNLDEGIDMFLDHQPDILFLDINLSNGITTFEFLDNYDIGNSQIIFITSYEEYALKAINNENVSAYLIKPIKIDNLIKAVSKTILKINSYYEKAINEDEGKNSNFIAVASINKIDLIPVEEIMFCTADGKYTVFETKNNLNYTSSKNLGQYQALLSSNTFFRIHHKHLVNINFIKSINKSDGYFCELINGKNLPISKRNQEKFSRFIRLKF
jgi:two-component system LytT family response regulator